MSVSGILGWLNIRGAEVLIDLPEEIYCGLETLVTVRLVNRRRYLPSFLLKVNVLGGAADFALVERGEERKSSFTGTFSERGEHLVFEGVISSPFPINFFVRSRRTPVEGRFVVFPAPLPSQMPGEFDRAGTSGVLATIAKGYEGDVAKIVDYSGADPLKLVHWRLSAKHGKLKVKELTADAQTPVIIDIDLLPGKNIDENLSRAVYLVNRLMRSNRPVGLKLRGRKIAPAVSRAHRLRLLSELALYGKH
ncbi:MAG TPA: DUF58 domain-containing protein [Geobacteraceae bacterium]|nr:DUF58 domain-containing protein [Geobacteraceae bacterium]